MVSPNDLSGVHVALTTPFDPATGSIALDLLETHASRLLDNGITGLVPNAPLGEYESMDRDERRAVVETVARVTMGRGRLIVAVSAPNWRVAGDHARHAAEVGADAVMLLPPTQHACTRVEIIDHFRSVAQHGLPIIIANDPFLTRTDLTPERIAELGDIDGVAAVTDLSGDVRRISEIIERAPHLELLCGADDLALESALMGATGWIGGLTGALPRAAVRLFELGRLGDVAAALPLYRTLLPLFRWNSGPRSVEAIKHVIDLLDLSGGGPPRPPRRILDDVDRELVTRQLQQARSVLPD